MSERDALIVHVECRLAEKDGRRAPIVEGFQMDLKFDGTDVLASAQLVSMQPSVASPGEEFKCTIRFLVDPQPIDAITVGADFELHEDGYLVGVGRVTRIDSPGGETAEPYYDLELVDLGEPGIAFANDRLGKLFYDDNGLNSRGKDLKASTVLAFSRTREPSRIHAEFRWSNTAFNGNTRLTEELVRRWIKASPPDRERVVAIEDKYGRRKDGNWRSWGLVIFKNTPYKLWTRAELDAEPEECGLSIGQFDDTAFLCEVPKPFAIEDEISDQTMAMLGDGVIGAVAEAWDDEGVAIVAIENRWDPWAYAP